MPIRWQVYPMSQRPSKLALGISTVFTAQAATIGTPPNKPLSDDVLRAVTPGLQSLGFQIKVDVPLLYGENGAVLKSFEVDAWNPDESAVLEVEAGVAIDARKIYQDLFEGFAMPDIRFFCVAVQNAYHPPRRKKAFDDYARAKAIFDSLFASRVVLPLDTVMLLGY